MRKKDSGGVLDAIGHVFAQGAADLKDVALGMPAGLYALGHAGYELAGGDPEEALGIGKATVEGLIEDIRHPLRHPGYTLLDLLPLVSAGAGGAARVGLAARAARAGGSVERALLTNPAKQSERIIRGTTGGVGKGHYSRSGLGYASQRAIDAYMQRAAPGSRREVALDRRIGKWNDRRNRIEEAVLNANVNKLWQVGRKFSNPESEAIRHVAEGVPVERRVRAASTRLDEARSRVGNKRGGVDGRTVRRLEERLGWTQEGVQHVDIDPSTGLASFKATPEGERLSKFYDQMVQVIGDREGILEALDLLDADRGLGAKQRVGRYVAGATYVEPTAARMGHTPRLTQATRYRTRLERRFNRLVEKQRPGSYTTRKRSRAEAIDHLAQLTMERDLALKGIADAHFGPVNMSDVRARNRNNIRARRQASGKTRSGKWSGASTWKSNLLPTIWDERYRDAQRIVDEAILADPEHPVSKRYAERDAEIARLSEILDPNPETIFGEGPAFGPAAGEAPTEPPVPPGHIRLYRGEGSTAPVGENTGLNFTPQRGYAELYGKKSVHYVDLTREEWRRLTPGLQVPFHDPELGFMSSASEYVVPPEVAKRMAPLTSKAKPKRKPEPDYGDVPKFVPRSARLERLGGGLSHARDEEEAAFLAAQRNMKDVGVVGAEDLIVPSSAQFIGYPKEFGRIRSAKPPPSSSGGTLGHTREPSLRESKGTTIQYGMYEPNVAKVVTARGRQANRLHSLYRRIEQARPGGQLRPSRADDVWLWNDDKIVSQRVLPSIVKEYRENPDAFDTPEKMEDVATGVKGMLMRWADNPRHDWRLDPKQRADLEAAAQRGEGLFVPRALLGDAGKAMPYNLPPRLTSVTDAINNVQKTLLIYLKLNYPIVQGLSNTGMNFIQQGFAAPKNIGKSVWLMHKDPELAAILGDIMGTGALMELAFEGTSKTSLLAQKSAHYASHYVDGPARLSALRYELDKAGYKTHDQIRALVKDDSKADELGEIAQRAKEAIVDYGDLGDAERNLIRRMFFVYPWLKGSTKWTAHFLRDHPVQAAVLNRLGVVGTETSREQFPALPSYLEGAFKGPTGGLVNPAGFNPFQTPTSIGQTIAGLATGNPTLPRGAQFVTPAIGTALSLLTGRDTLDRPLEGSLPARLRQLQVSPAPLVQLIRSAASAAGLPSDPGTVNNIMDTLFGATREGKQFPNPNDPMWRFLLGGLYPREYSQAGLSRAAGLEASGR